MKFRSLLRLLALLALPTLLAAQSSNGFNGPLQFATWASGGPEMVNLGSLDTHWSIPIYARHGRKTDFTYALVLDTNVWQPYNSWTPTAQWGWTVETQAVTGYVNYDAFMNTCSDFDGDSEYYEVFDNFSFVDQYGARHPFDGSIANWPDDCTYHLQGDNQSDPYPPSLYEVLSSDGSGYTITAYPDTGGPSSADVTTKAGAHLSPPLLEGTGDGIYTDANGNKITSSGGVFTDTLGTTALTVTEHTGETDYAYRNPQGGTSTVEVLYTDKTVRTNFGCSSTAEYNQSSVPLISSIVVPGVGTYSFTYEATPGYSGDVTGRVASVTLPTGGEVSYSYGGANGGVNCYDGTPVSLTRTTPDGTWSYAHTWSGTASNTLVTDPAGNQQYYQFEGSALEPTPFETQRDLYDGTKAGNSVIEEVTTCYNGATAPCNTTDVAAGFTRRTMITTLQPAASDLVSKRDEYYDSSDDLTEADDYDWQASSAGSLLRKTLTSYWAPGYPSQITVENPDATTAAKTSFTYDQGTPVATSGVPQHTTAPGSRGNLTEIQEYTSGSSYLQKNFSYFDTGMEQTESVWGGTPTTSLTYTYDSTAQAFPVTVVQQTGTSSSLTTHATWSQSGGVTLTTTDADSQVTTYKYNDADLWRPTEIDAADGGVKTLTYTEHSGSTPASVESAMTFNSGNSAQDLLTTEDGLGRPYLRQRRQGPSGSVSNFDSVETVYDAMGRPYQQSMPYTATAGGGPPSGTVFSTTTYDPLSRPAVVTDGGGGTVTYTYTGNDVLSNAASPTVAKQEEFDGLGRLTSVCELTSASGHVSCGQTNAENGYWSKYTYNTLGAITGVTQNALGSTTETRSFGFDELGRLTSETNPESGTTAYTFDSDSTCGTSYGNLVKRHDANGTVTCYAYDLAQRVTQISYPTLGSGVQSTATKNFVYDSATVDSHAMDNAGGRLAEAYTGTSSSKATDLGFSYSAVGQIAATYQASPNSGGWYTTSATYFANGATATLAQPGAPTASYGLDGEGRPTTVGAASGQNPVTAAAYSALGLTSLTLGSGDGDGYTYDAHTGRMTQYQFTVNGATDTGALGWNSNGSLASLGITDHVSTTDSQSCSYSHDDLGRVSEANCGTGQDQTFGYDPFGNLTSGGTPTGLNFDFSFSGNRVGTGGSFTAQYDSDGNLLDDPAVPAAGVNAYDGEGKATTLESVGVTYDALGRAVEAGVTGGPQEFVYGPSGAMMGVMKGQTAVTATVPLPGGGAAVYAAGTLSYYRHVDHLGSSRLASTTSQGLYAAAAYAPYGAAYDETTTKDRSFTGMGENMDGTTSGGQYDFLDREYNPIQGRWWTPDPAGLAAVDPNNPQTWNRYGYVAGMLLDATDPLGLTCVEAHSVGIAPMLRNCAPPKPICITFMGITWCPGDGGPLPPPPAGPHNDSGNGTAVRAPDNMPTVSHCLGVAAADKGASIGLDILGAIPAVGNAVSAGAGIVRAGIAVNRVITSPVVAVGSGVYGAYEAVTAGPEEATDSLVGSASAGAGVGLALADASLAGTKAIPVAGNIVSGLTALWDGYQAFQKYQSCMAGN